MTGLAHLHAETLAKRLWAAAARGGWTHVWPLWADGGADGVNPTHFQFAPGQHVLAAFPERVITWRRSGEEIGALTEWLRRELPSAGPARVPLVVCALAYDAGRNGEWVADGLAPERPDGSADADADALPDAVLAVYPAYLVAPTESGPWEWVGTPSAAFLDALTAPSEGLPLAAPAIAGLHDRAGYAPYAQGVERVLAAIAAGDLYQANIARALRTPFDPAAAPGLFHAWRRAQPNAFAAFWPLGDGAFLVSNSPECLLAWNAETRTARSFPIKGTAPRGASAEADTASAQTLAASSKDSAEHVMIVDLVRHDLGRVAVPGSVAVPALMAPYPLATLHHLVSEVACTVRPECDLADVLATLFPGGSITGAPKIAAMNLIASVEPFRRGYYCGSLGLVFGGAEAVFSILIRTAIVARGELVYATGGGIVADSEVASEWAETEVKARALAIALGAAVTPRPSDPVSPA